MSHVEDVRPLIGRLQVNSMCLVEFSPASTSVKYACELVNRFIELETVQGIINGQYVVVSRWNWLGSSAPSVGTPVLVVDLSAVSLATKEPLDQYESESGPVIGLRLTVKAVSGFLRIKDANDPFNNTFCVHSSENEIFAFRGPNMFLFKFFFTAGSIVELSGFRKIKLKTCNNTLIYMSMEDSRVTRYEPFSSSLIRGITSLRTMTGRVTGIACGVVWISLIGEEGQELKPLIPGRWATCERRRIAVGSVLSIFNAHVSEGVVSLCPSLSSITIENIPPIANAVSMHTIGKPVDDQRCEYHFVNDIKNCSNSAKSKSSFGVNSLVLCDCCLDCREKNEIIQDTKGNGTSQGSLESFTVKFVEALKASELCMSLISVADIFLLKTPPFFNISLMEPLRVKHIGIPSPEVAKSLESMPRTLFLTLFPPRRPLNSFLILLLSIENARELSFLVPRTFQSTPNSKLIVKHALIVNSTKGSPVNGIILKPETLQICTDGNDSQPSSPSCKTMTRRIEMSNRLRDSTS